MHGLGQLAPFQHLRGPWLEVRDLQRLQVGLSVEPLE